MIFKFFEVGELQRGGLVDLFWMRAVGVGDVGDAPHLRSVPSSPDYWLCGAFLLSHTLQCHLRRFFFHRDQLLFLFSTGPVHSEQALDESVSTVSSSVIANGITNPLGRRPRCHREVASLIRRSDWDVRIAQKKTSR